MESEKLIKYMQIRSTNLRIDPVARLTRAEMCRVEMFPDSVNRILSGNFPEKEFFGNRGQVNLICTNVNRPFAYRRLTLPHIIFNPSSGE